MVEVCHLVQHSYETALNLLDTAYHEERKLVNFCFEVAFFQKATLQ